MDLGSGGVATTPGGETVTGWLAVCGLPGDARIQIRYIEDTDWLTEWRKHHHTMDIGRRLRIVPSWIPLEPDDGRVTVVLDPGMAFGTGSHPSTKLCLEALDAMVRPDMDVVDTGTGSGILAIAAVKLGARHVWASECDALPRTIAAENAARNGIADRIEVMTPEQLDARRPAADIVVCNIIAETIIQLAPLLKDMVRRPDGILITSGIVEERLSAVADALERHNLRIADIRSDDVWRALIAGHAPLG